MLEYTLINVGVSVVAAGSSLSHSLFSLGDVIMCNQMCTGAHYGSVLKAQ